MNPEFPAVSETQQQRTSSQIDQLFQALSGILIQVNHTNQTLVNFMQSERNIGVDSRVRSKPFLGLPSEDILKWLDHFDNISFYRQWTDDRKALEARTLFEDVAATWFIQQPDEVKSNWQLLRVLLIQNFAHQNVTQTALQQLTVLQQQPNEPVGQFAVRLNQLLMRADPNMPEEMKLYFLWPKLRPELSNRTQDQAPLTFNAAINIAQRIEAHTTLSSSRTTPLLPTPVPAPFSPPFRSHPDSIPVPMDIDQTNFQYQNLQRQQTNMQRQPQRLPLYDNTGRPRCFYYNLYGHIKRNCRKYQAQFQRQNMQLQITDSTTLAGLQENI